MDTTLDSTLVDDYDEPIWKSKANRSTHEKISYSKKNTDKFLDKNKANDNRDLFLDLFHEDPNELTCNEKEFEKYLFDGIQSQGNDLDKTKKATKRKRATKKKNDENPDFLTDQYQRGLVKQKDKLQEIFEKTPVYQNLQALKDKPLNIEEVDSSGKVTRRFEYYFDYEKDKHDIIEIKNGDKGDSSRRNDASESENESIEDVLRTNQKINRNKNESSLKRKRPNAKSSDKSTSKSNKTNKSANKSMNKTANKKSTSDKSISKTASKSSSKSSSNKTATKAASSLKRKSVVDEVQADQNQRPTRKRTKVNYSEN